MTEQKPYLWTILLTLVAQFIPKNIWRPSWKVKKSTYLSQIIQAVILYFLYFQIDNQERFSFIYFFGFKAHRFFKENVPFRLKYGLNLGCALKPSMLTPQNIKYARFPW